MSGTSTAVYRKEQREQANALLEKFLDGELLEGTVGKVRKFTFVLHTDSGNIMVFKVGAKYIAEVL